MMRISSMLVGWAVAAGLLAVSACETAATVPHEPALRRPSEASQGLRAAIVVAVAGTATIKPMQGAPFDAAPDQELLADDTVVTAGDGFVMLELHNGHIVRMRSGDGLRVDRTAAFGEPAAAGALADRLAMALSKEETSDPRLQVAARVAGWNMRMSSAQTFGVQQAPRVAEMNMSGGSTKPPGGESAAEPAADRVLGREEAKVPDGDKEVSPPAASKDEKSSPRSPPPPPRQSPPPPGDAAPQPEHSDPKKSSESPELDDGAVLDLPGSVDFRPDGGAKRSVGLPEPLKAKRRELAVCAGRGTQIRAQVKGKKLVKLEVAGADKCSAGIVGGAIALEDGWLELRVTP